MNSCTDAHPRMHQHTWKPECMLIHAGAQYTRKYVHIHACTYTHQHLHVCSHGCIHTYTGTHICTCTHTHMQVHMPPCTHTCTTEATEAFPVGRDLGYSVCFPSLQRKITQSTKNHSSWPQMDGWSPQKPQEIICTLQGSETLESHDPWSLLATGLQLGFRAVSGDNLRGLRWIALSVRKDVIYLTGGATLAPKKMFSLSCSPSDIKTHSER